MARDERNALENHTVVQLTKSNLPEESRRLSDVEEEADVRTELPPPPDGGYGWVIVGASFFCNMVVDGIAYTFGMFLAQFAEYFGEGKGTVSWVGSLLTGMLFIIGPVAGGLANKYGCRTVSIAGSLLGSAAFALSTLSPNVAVLMLIYGILGGVGFGLIYLPAVVCVGYYFETKRSLATGISVCGSGFGTFVFAPLASFLLAHFTWQGANLVLAGIILSCAIFGVLMKPLKFKEPPKHIPLLQRMAEDKRKQWEAGSVQGSYLMVRLADGTMQRMMKVAPINIDPGVHSALYLDQLGPPTPVSAAPPGVLPPIAEHRSPFSSRGELRGLPHVATQPEMARTGKSAVDNGSEPLLNRSGWKKSNDDAVFTTSRTSVRMSKDQLRPMVKKDVFYAGSVQNLKEYQSQGSLVAYRQSTLSVNRSNSKRDLQGEDATGSSPTHAWSCLTEPLLSVFTSMVDVSLIKDPVFLFIAFSNLSAFVALYVPFVYLVDHVMKDGIEAQDASVLISVIGISNTIGRIVCGWISDFPSVNSLLLNNCSLLLATLAVFSISFCHSYYAYLSVALVFGIAISIFISLTSIILVDLLGLDKLTNAFGLLLLFRGVAALLGTPLAGMVYDATGSYHYPFIMAALFFLISAALSFIVPFLKPRETEELGPVVISSLERIEEGEEE